MSSLDILQYIESALASRGITEEDYLHKGLHSFRFNRNQLVSEYTSRLRQRGGIEFHYGYIVPHDKLKASEIAEECGLMETEFIRQMPPGETDIVTTFEGDRTYYFALVDGATLFDLVRISVRNGEIIGNRTDIPSGITNPYNPMFLDVKGTLKTEYIDRMIAIYLQGGPIQDRLVIDEN